MDKKKYNLTRRDIENTAKDFEHYPIAKKKFIRDVFEKDDLTSCLFPKAKYGGYIEPLKY